MVHHIKEVGRLSSKKLPQTEPLQEAELPASQMPNSYSLGPHPSLRALGVKGTQKFLASVARPFGPRSLRLRNFCSTALDTLRPFGCGGPAGSKTWADFSVSGEISKVRAKLRTKFDLQWGGAVLGECGKCRKGQTGHAQTGERAQGGSAQAVLGPSPALALAWKVRQMEQSVRTAHNSQLPITLPEDLVTPKAPSASRRTHS